MNKGGTPMLRNTLKTLLSAWGPSGSEHNVTAIIK